MIDKEFVDAIAELKSRSLPVDMMVTGIDSGRPEHLAGRLYHLTVPDGVKTTDITDALLKTLPNPQHRSGTTEIASLQSFIEFTNRMKLANTVLFANPKKSTIEAVFDYHDEVNPGWNIVPDPDDAKGTLASEATKAYVAKPQWGRFRARYPFPLHRSWETWKAKDKQPMSQADLANFIEDNIIDVHDTQEGAHVQSESIRILLKELTLKLAGRAKLLSAARGLSIQVTEKVGSVVNTQTGETTIHYEQTHADGTAPAPGTLAKLDVPSAFIILLPVYTGSDAFELLVRLRYRKDAGVLRWWYDIYNIDRAIELAFEDACKKIVYGTTLPLFFVNS